MDNCKGCYMRKDTGCMALKKKVRYTCWAKCKTSDELIRRYKGHKAKDIDEQKVIDGELEFLLKRNGVYND